MQDKNYSQAVNRRLAGAKFHLSLTSQPTAELIDWQKNTCLEAALMQLYLALHHYLNELLSHYHHSAVTETSLADIFQRSSTVFTEIPEFEELKQTIANPEAHWLLLLELPDDLKALAPAQEVKPISAVPYSRQEDLLITRNLDIHCADLRQATVIKSLISQLEALVLRQRANFAEY